VFLPGAPKRTQGQAFLLYFHPVAGRLRGGQFMPWPSARQSWMEGLTTTAPCGLMEPCSSKRHVHDKLQNIKWIFCISAGTVPILAQSAWEGALAFDPRFQKADRAERPSDLSSRPPVPVTTKTANGTTRQPWPRCCEIQCRRRAEVNYVRHRLPLPHVTRNASAPEGLEKERSPQRGATLRRPRAANGLQAVSGNKRRWGKEGADGPKRRAVEEGLSRS